MKLICKNQCGDGDCVISKFQTQKEAIMLLESLLTATNHFSLMSDLNDLQNDCRDDNGNTLFPDKYKVPLKIINLIIQKYRLRIVDGP